MLLAVVPALDKMMEMKKRILPLQPEARAPLPREGKGPGEGLLKAECRMINIE